MKIGIFCEPHQAALGGSEYRVAVLGQALRRRYTYWEWKRRFSTYQTTIAISRFTREYAKRWWNLDCEVVYPPISNDFKVTAKSNSILSVGRFATLGHSKKHLEMITAFNRRTGPALAEWDYYYVGGLSSLTEDVDYFESVRDRAIRRACARHGERGARRVAKAVRAVEDPLACRRLR